MASIAENTYKSMPSSSYVTFFRSELVWLLAALHVMMTSSRVSALLILIVCGPIPDLQLCPCYLKNPPKAGNNRHFMSKYYFRLSMLPAYQTALWVLIPVQCRLRGKFITVNEVQGSGQLINFIQFLDNKRSSLHCFSNC